MTKRTKNHRTGKAAVIEFSKLASEAWEVREKSGDYGVDLEIELFNAHDNATGTVAYVQSKGTASAELEPKVSIRLETLRYLNSFDVPSLIFCYSTSTQKSYWMWAQEAIWSAKPNAKTVSLKFRRQHLWNDATTNEIERSLNYNRLLKARFNYVSFSILLDENESEVDSLFLNSVLAEVCSLLPITNHTRLENDISLKVSICETKIEIRMERFLWRSIDAKSEDFLDLRNALIYLILTFWDEFGFSNHAERAAMVCLEKQLRSPDRESSSYAAIVLINRPQVAVKFALMNELHLATDIPMNRFFYSLYNSIASYDETANPIQTFTYAALYQTPDKKPNSALLYTLGKFHRNNFQYSKAFTVYNRLRKIDSSYLKRTYFWYELGGIIFRLKKYRMAAICYKNLVDIEKLPITQLLLADAYYFANNLREAKMSYFAAKHDQTSIGAEAELKYAIVLWFESMDHSIRPDSSSWVQILHLRKDALSYDNYEIAFLSQMALTFLDIDDVDCWADAIFLSLRMNNLSCFQDVLRCAVNTHGLKPYIKFKADRAELFNYLGDNSNELDQLAQDIFDKTRFEKSYEPGVSIGEPEKLLEEGVLRLQSRL